jgi:hypothetical protein
MSKMTIKRLTETTWILENNHEKQSLVICKNDNTVQLIGKINERFDSFDSFVKKHKPIVIQNTQENSEKEQARINSFPVKHETYFHVQTDPVPSYSKNEANTARHAAGYYIVKTNNVWNSIFCPKIQTLENAEYMGPFTTKLEMQHQMNIKNKIKGDA